MGAETVCHMPGVCGRVLKGLRTFENCLDGESLSRGSGVFRNMSVQFVAGLMRKLLVALAAVLVVGTATAQDDGAGPPMAMGSGRMVRGTVTAAAGDRLTVKTDAGEVFQVAVTPNTQVRKGRELMKLADVHAGDGVGAMGEIDAPNKTVHALYLFVVDAEQVKKAREAMGKTYIAGKITAMDELKLTILRADGVSQVIAVDEDTSFKRGGRGMSQMLGGSGGGPGTTPEGNRAADRGGESITLAEVKVGDTVAGQGALKAGVFVPKQLYIGDPEARGRRRRDGAGTPAAAGAEPKQ